jgi:hypothetical protein
MDKENLLSKGPDGADQTEQTQSQSDVGKYKKMIERAEGPRKRKYNNWAKAGKRAFRGDDNNNDGDDEYDKAKMASHQAAGKLFKHDLNYLRQPIEAQIAKTYARNPKFIAKPSKPIFVDAPPMQQLDPFTGMPVMVPQIDPATGMPVQIDVSEQICDVVETVMEIEFKNAMFKSEAKLCTCEAHHSPASVMQIGYQFNEDDDIDEIYFRRRKFENFIIDPDADIYHGIVRRCRYMGLKWKLSKAECEAMGLDWSAIKSKDSLPGEDTDQKACVYNIWDKESGVVVWVAENGAKFAKEPQPWPWKIKGFPFEIYKLAEDTDEQFSKPPILRAVPIQEELTIQREEITATVTNSRPMTLYDPAAMDPDTIAGMTQRGKYSYIPVNGLMGMPQDPMRRIGDHQLTAEYYAHYERNRKELIEVLGTSENEALRATKSTAAEAQIVDRNAGNSTSAKIDTQTDFHNACAQKAVQIMKQTYTTERVTQVIGRDNSKYWVRWTGSQILQDIEIQIETGSTEREDSAYNRQIALNMLEVMKGIPGIDVTKLASDVLREHGKRNPEQYQLQMTPQPPMPGAGAGAGSAQNGATTGMNPGAGIGNQMNPIA